MNNSLCFYRLYYLRKPFTTCCPSTQDHSAIEHGCENGDGLDDLDGVVVPCTRGC